MVREVDLTETTRGVAMSDTRVYQNAADVQIDYLENIRDLLKKLTIQMDIVLLELRRLRELKTGG